MKKLIPILLISLMMLPMISCDDPSSLGDNTWKFSNRSSITLNITPNGQSWSGFTLSPENSRKVTVDADTIYFFYNPGNVTVDKSDDGKIKFYDL